MATFLRSAGCQALLGRRLTAVRPAAVRGGAGMPVGTAPAPSAPLPETEELTWDDGTPYPDDCIDNWAPMLTSGEGLAYLAIGLSFFGMLGAAAAFNNKAARIPWLNWRFALGAILRFCLLYSIRRECMCQSRILMVPRDYPYDNLRVELGGEP